MIVRTECSIGAALVCACLAPILLSCAQHTGFSFGKPYLPPTWPRPGQLEYPALGAQEPLASFYLEGKSGLTVGAEEEDTDWGALL